MRYLIIEHPTRGILMGWEFEYIKGGEQVCKPRFSYTKRRSEAHKFFLIYDLRERASKMKLPKGCYIVSMPRGEVQPLAKP